MPVFSPPYPVENVQYNAPVTGASITINASTTALLVNPAGTIAALTVVLPATPFNGQSVTVASSQIVTALTVTGTIVGTLTTLALGGFARFVYSADASTWFRAG
jgi:hypothetical protein